MAQNIREKDEKITSNCKISTFRRIAPQVKCTNVIACPHSFEPVFEIEKFFLLHCC